MAGFKSSFAAARKAGKKEFTWNGKRYNTKLASDSKTPAKGPVPSSRTGQDKGSGGRATSAQTSAKKDTLNRSAINKTNAATRAAVEKKNQRNKK